MGCEEARMLLDACVDGELTAQQEADLLAHVHACEACMEDYKVAMLLRDCLKDMDEDVAVPLEAQAAWRRAVHAEAKKRISRKWSRTASVAAVVLVLLVGMGFVTKDRVPAQQPMPGIVELSVNSASAPVEMSAADAGRQNAAAGAELIAADGNEEAAVAAAGIDDGCTVRKKFTAGSLEAAGEAVEMLTAEYSGRFTVEKEADSVLYRVELPGDYMEDFLNAAAGIGTELDSETLEAAGETVVILIQIDAA